MNHQKVESVFAKKIKITVAFFQTKYRKRGKIRDLYKLKKGFKQIFKNICKIQSLSFD